MASGRRARGRDGHEVGTLLNTLYMRHADVVLGFPSFRHLLIANWHDRLDEAYGSMLIARECTVTQAETHGFWKALYGVRLMAKLGLETFVALEAHDFGQTPASITFEELSVTEVQVLSGRPALPAAEPDEKVGRAVVRLRHKAEALQASHEAYAPGPDLRRRRPALRHRDLLRARRRRGRAPLPRRPLEVAGGAAGEISHQGTIPRKIGGLEKSTPGDGRALAAARESRVRSAGLRGWGQTPRKRLSRGRRPWERPRP